MVEATEQTVLCECGHPLSHHAVGGGECYAYTRRNEKKKNHKGEIVKVRCIYNCTCKCFKFEEDCKISVSGKEASGMSECGASFHGKRKQ